MLVNAVNNERPVLIIDCMNLFVRSFCAYPTMNVNGEQVGGTIGFLKTMRRIAYEVQPVSIYAAWESGGSSRRRALYSEYKLGRRPEKLNRFYEDDIPDSNENRQHQIITLLNMLKKTPVCQLHVPDVEGDDVIAYLCKNTFKDVNKVIVSSDKDLFQLLDDKTKNYNLHKKTFVTAENVLEDFRVLPCNFSIAKALCGDASDNIPGMKGLGFKTLNKWFPFLGAEKDTLLQDVFSYCHTHKDESKVFGRVLDAQEDIKRNYRLVYLDGSMISSSAANHLEQTIKTFSPSLNRMELTRLMLKEGVHDFDVEGFAYTFNCIEGIQQK